MGIFSFLSGGSSTSMAAKDARNVVLKASDILREVKDKPMSLRRLLASAIGGTTTPDSPPVTAVIKEIKSYGGLPASEEPTSWWESADKSAQMTVLSQTAQCLQ